MTAVLDSPRLTLPVSGRDHILGSPGATRTLVEYGDYECPFCAAAHPVVKHLLRIAGDEITFAYRHFPLTQVHPHAEPAAEAAEAAGSQGSFWKMHDLLFESRRLGPRDLLGHASAIGLDVERFAAELDAHTHRPRVREDFLSGVRSGVNGTPTFFVNGIRHNGGGDPDSLSRALGL
jgi:protein-disulfide isomerase